MKVLLVCLGNICRSPAAEVVLRQRAAGAGLALTVDSAGTGAWHEGKPPDPRMIAAAKKRRYDLATLRGRQIDHGDGNVFDHILVMDRSNLRDVEAMRLPDWTASVRMLDTREVPDPYEGGPEGFEKVLDQLEAAADRLVRDWKPDA